MHMGYIIYEFDNYRLDISRRILLHNGVRVKIPAKSLSILILLIENDGRAVSKEEIIREVWPNSFVEDNNFNVTLRAVRQALGESARNPKYIVNTSEGYIFIGSVREVQENAVIITGSLDKSPVITEEQCATDQSIKPHSEARTVVPEGIQVNPGLLGGHSWHILTACVIYANLYGVALLVEIAYEFDRFGGTALQIAPLIFFWILLTSTAGLTIDWKRTSQGRPGGLGLCWLIFLFSGIVLFGAVSQFLPPTPVTQAKFQTHTAQAVYIKEICYFIVLATVFLIMPFHFVVTMERELSQGNLKTVFGLLTGDKRIAAPKGIIYIKAQLLGFLLGMITIWSLIVRAYVLDQLQPSPYTNLFMGLYYVRLFLFIGLPAYCLIWYYRALNDLKRSSLGNQNLAIIE
jgi:DNA-binding winged helix-turn-helix (wHTH) protein